VDTVSEWTPDSLLAAGFEERCKDIKLSERGSGFWAWKPFIIHQKLQEVPDGDLVFYCDVGRRYPYILLDHPLAPFTEWMDERKQDLLPGTLIPWSGSMSVWTKQDAWAATHLDSPGFRAASPIQASFSCWRATEYTRRIASEWLDLCSQRNLVSDDPSSTATAESEEFKAHRHDQSLLTLCCLKHGIQGLDIGQAEPPYNERDPSQVAAQVFGTPPHQTAMGKMLACAANLAQRVERLIRNRVTLGKNYD
jgi:hypothetical protein